MMFLLHLIDESIVLSGFFIVIILPLTCAPSIALPFASCNLGGSFIYDIKFLGCIPIQSYIPLAKISDREI